jgi:hypothetical protein
LDFNESFKKEISPQHDLLNPIHRSISREACENLGMYFTKKEIELLKGASGAVSREDLMQKLCDPPKIFRPSTNMNTTGNLTAINLTYKDTRQFEKGVSRLRNRQIKGAYSSAVADKNYISVKSIHGRNTYVNYPNKS